MICSLPEGFPLKRRTNPVHHGLAAFTAGRFGGPAEPLWAARFSPTTGGGAPGGSRLGSEDGTVGISTVNHTLW